MEMSQPAEPVFLDEVLRPNPPMSPRALGIVLGVVAAINIAFVVGFLSRGAWPIAPFMGADVALLAWAFHSSRIAARAFEHVRVTTSELFVTRHPARGQAEDVLLNPYWVSVHLEQPEDMPRKLTLHSHGKSMQLGSFLGPRERLSFALALKAALNAARNWRPV
jgi:uncharacterized membrane protein